VAVERHTGVLDHTSGDGRERALALPVSDGVIVTDASVDEPGPRILWFTDAVTQLTGHTRANSR